MTDELHFEVRPIEGAFAAVGETVAFRREGGKLYALNEDGEAFGVVPSKFAAAICGQPAETLTAEVAGRGESGFLTVQVAFKEVGGELANEPSAAPANQAAPALAEAPAPGPAAPAVPAADEATAQVPVAKAPSRTGTAAEPAAVEKARALQSKKKLPVWAKVALGVLAAVVVLVVVLVGIVLIGTEATQTVTVGHVSLEVPESWSVEDNGADEDDLNEYCYSINADDDPEENPISIVILADMPADPYCTDDYLPYFLIATGVEDEDAPVDEYTTDEGAIVYRYECEFESDSGTSAKGYLQVVVSGDYGTFIVAASPADEFDDHDEELQEILNTLTIIDAEEPSYSQVQEEESTQSVTLGSVTIEVPESWALEDTSYSGNTQTRIKADDFDATVYMTYDSYDVKYDVNSMDIIISLRETDYGFGSPSLEYSTAEGFVCCYEREPDDDSTWCYDVLVVSESAYLETSTTSKYRYVEISIYCAPDEFDAHAEELEAILDSMTIEEDE